MKALLISLIKAFIWGVVCIFAIPLACACAATLDLSTSKSVPVTKPAPTPVETKEHLNLKHLFSPKHGEHQRLSTDRQGLT